MVLLPECLPVLSELLEDENKEIYAWLKNQSEDAFHDFKKAGQ